MTSTKPIYIAARKILVGVNESISKLDTDWDKISRDEKIHDTNMALLFLGSVRNLLYNARDQEQGLK